MSIDFNSVTRRDSLKIAGSAASVVGLGQTSLAMAQNALPDTMVWSTYDVGSTGYVEASAIADAFGKKYGTRVRLQPSGTAVGRVQPVLTKRVSVGWLASEVFFACEGLYEFCTPDWGPQDLRTLAGRINSSGLVATKASGIKNIKDLRGRRFALAPGNSSVNSKIEPMLAFAGLTWKDLDIVEVPSYGAALKALTEGRAEAAGGTATAAALYELESSSKGIQWLAMPKDNTAGWERIQRMVPFLEPVLETVGAGISKENPVWMIGYRYPMITVRADASSDETYRFLKSVAESYNLYKDAAPIMPRWDIKKSGTPPMDAPFHDGAIRYLKEIGQWSDKEQKWQDAILKRQTALKKEWQLFIANSEVKSADSNKFKALWLERRQKIINSL